MSSSLPYKPLPFILYFLKPYRLWLGAMFLSVLGGAACESIQPYIVKLLVNTLGPDAVHGPNFLSQIVTMGLFFAGLRFFIILFWALVQTFRMKIEPFAEAAIQKTLLEKLFAHSYSWFLEGFAGRTGQRVDTAARSFRDLFGLIFEDVLFVVACTITILGLLLYTDPWLGLSFAVWLSLVVLVARYLSRLIERQSFLWIASSGEFTQRVVDICANIFSVKANGHAGHREKSESGHIADQAALHHKGLIALIRWTNAIRTGMNTLLYAILIVIGFWRWHVDAIDLGEYAMVFTATIFIIDVMDSFSKKTQLISQTVGTLQESLDGLLQNLPSYSAGQKAFQPGFGKIDFSAVSFSYRPSIPVLQNFSLSIAAGEKVALVGPSGAGKTTLMALLLTLWHVQQGKILIDGQDLSTLDPETFLNHVAVIPQDTSLFHRTLFENIAYGSLDADTESVAAAARAAHIHDFIMAQPDGYKTLVGERGLKLSGGQRQRIAVARAIHKNAPILLLDEATSALDSESERAIQDALHKLIAGKTVVAIAHRLSTIAHMDRILFLEAGQIVEEGSHAALLALDGRYARLWSMQSGGYLPEPVQ